MTNKLQKEANASYQKINERWLNFHYHVILLCVLAGMTFEIIIYFIIRFTGVMFDSDLIYWLKYILAPTTIEVLIAGCAFFALRHKNWSIVLKQYAISIFMMLVAATLSFAHGGYEAVLFTFLLPILMTIMYENKRLTYVVTLITIPLEILTGLSNFWDPHKVISHEYMINLIITIALTIVTWLVSLYMIRFSLVKKVSIIQKDVERQFLKEQILVDELTDVANKRALFQRLESLEGKSCIYYLAMLDIDQFKQINDCFGHLYGDEVLRCLGAAMKTMRSECSVYRYGGDEFSVIIKDENEQRVIRDIQSLQQEFVKKLEQAKYDKTHPITVSAGISSNRGGLAYLEIIRMADKALYKSKKREGNTITCRL